MQFTNWFQIIAMSGQTKGGSDAVFQNFSEKVIEMLPLFNGDPYSSIYVENKVEIREDITSVSVPKI